MTILERSSLEAVQFKEYGIDTITYKDHKSEADIELRCDTLLCACDNSIDANLMKAFVNSGLVYNARIVVDAAFQTADDNIYAIGTKVKLSKQYGQQHTFAGCNVREMGQQFALALLNRELSESSIDMTYSAVRSGGRRHHAAKPTAAAVSAQSENPFHLPRYYYPAITTATLLHDFRYVRCALPVLPTDIHEYTTRDDLSGAITTLKTDPLGVIVEISYLGKQDVNPFIFSRVVGWHEAILRDAVNSYIRGEITDWSR